MSVINETEAAQEPVRHVLIPPKTSQHEDSRPVIVPARLSGTFTSIEQVRIARARHWRKIMLWLAAGGAAVTLGLLALTGMTKTPEIPPEPPPPLQRGILHEMGTIEALSETMVLGRFAGDIVWKIDEGVMVERGDPVVRFEDKKEREDLESREKDLFDKQEAVRRAKADIETAREKYKCQIRQSEIALEEAEIDRKRIYEYPRADDKLDAELSLKAATLELKQMQTQIDAQEALHKQGYISDAAYKKALLDLATKKVNYSKAKLICDITLQGYTADAKRVADMAVADAKKTVQITIFNRDADLAVDQAALELAQIDLANFERDLARKRESVANATVRAPVRGRVAFVEVWKGGTKSRSPIQVGENRTLGSDLCSICDTSSLRARVLVNESDISKVALKQKATIRLPALPGRTFQAEVAEIGVAALDKNLALSNLALRRAGEAFINVIPVKLEFVGLTEQDKRDIRIGFSADVYIQAE